MLDSVHHITKSRYRVCCHGARRALLGLCCSGCGLAPARPIPGPQHPQGISEVLVLGQCWEMLEACQQMHRIWSFPPSNNTNIVSVFFQSLPGGGGGIARGAPSCMQSAPFPAMPCGSQARRAAEIAALAAAATCKSGGRCLPYFICR